MISKTVLAVLTAIVIGSASVAHSATLTLCNVNDVTIDGNAADACVGMIDGNVNSLSDINSIISTDYSYYTSTDITFGAGTFSFADVYGDRVGIAIKQNTKWAVYEFDLSDDLTGPDNVWNGTWSTNGSQWDGNPRVVGCQGCGGLSHGALVYDGSTEVPVPGTLGLLGLGLMGLGALRRQM